MALTRSEASPFQKLRCLPGEGVVFVIGQPYLPDALAHHLHYTWLDFHGYQVAVTAQTSSHLDSACLFCAEYVPTSHIPNIAASRLT